MELKKFGSFEELKNDDPSSGKTDEKKLQELMNKVFVKFTEENKGGPIYPEEDYNKREIKLEGKIQEVPQKSYSRDLFLKELEHYENEIKKHNTGAERSDAT